MFQENIFYDFHLLKVIFSIILDKLLSNILSKIHKFSELPQLMVIK